MRNLSLNLFSCVIFFSTSFGMENTPQRGWIERGIHWVDKEFRPLNFFTDNKAPEVRMIMEKYDPAHPQYQQFSGDKKCHEDVVSALTRQKKALEVARKSIVARKSHKIERLKTAQNTESSYFSPNLLAIIDGYYETHIEAGQARLAKLSQGVRKVSPSPTALANGDTKFFPIENITFPDENNFPSQETVKKEVANHGILANTWDYLTSTHEKRINSVLNETSQITAMATLHFHPCHPHHTSEWRLNPDLAFHVDVINGAANLEIELINLVQDAILANDTNTLFKLNPNNQDNKKMRESIASYYSPILKAIIAGYLDKVRINNEEQEKRRIIKEKEQKEFIEKRNEAHALINFLRKKLDDGKNKEKLQSLTEEQRSILTIEESKLLSLSVSLAEVREANKVLNELSLLITQLLEKQPLEEKNNNHALIPPQNPPYNPPPSDSSKATEDTNNTSNDSAADRTSRPLPPDPLRKKS